MYVLYMGDVLMIPAARPVTYFFLGPAQLDPAQPAGRPARADLWGWTMYAKLVKPT